MSGSFPSLPPGGWQGDNAQLQQYLPQYCQWLRQQGASEEQVKEAACQIDPQAWASLQFGQPGVVGPPTGKSDMFHPSQPPMDQNGTGSEAPLTWRRGEEPMWAKSLGQQMPTEKMSPAAALKQVPIKSALKKPTTTTTTATTTAQSKSLSLLAGNKWTTSNIGGGNAKILKAAGSSVPAQQPASLPPPLAPTVISNPTPAVPSPVLDQFGTSYNPWQASLIPPMPIQMDGASCMEIFFVHPVQVENITTDAHLQPSHTGTRISMALWEKVKTPLLPCKEDVTAQAVEAAFPVRVRGKTKLNIVIEGVQILVDNAMVFEGQTPVESLVLGIDVMQAVGLIWDIGTFQICVQVGRVPIKILSNNERLVSCKPTKDMQKVITGPFSSAYNLPEDTLSHRRPLDSSWPAGDPSSMIGGRRSPILVGRRDRSFGSSSSDRDFSPLPGGSRRDRSLSPYTRRRDRSPLSNSGRRDRSPLSLSGRRNRSPLGRRDFSPVSNSSNRRDTTSSSRRDWSPLPRETSRYSPPWTSNRDHSPNRKQYVPPSPGRSQQKDLYRRSPRRESDSSRPRSPPRTESQYRQNRRNSPPRKSRRSPSPEHKARRSLSPARKNRRSPSPARKNRRSPSPARKNRRSPSPARKNRRSPSPARKNRRDPSPARKSRRSQSPPRKAKGKSPQRNKRESPFQERRKTVPAPSSAKRSDIRNSEFIGIRSSSKTTSARPADTSKPAQPKVNTQYKSNLREVPLVASSDNKAKEPSKQQASNKINSKKENKNSQATSALRQEEKLTLTQPKTIAVIDKPELKSDTVSDNKTLVVASSSIQGQNKSTLKETIPANKSAISVKRKRLSPTNSPIHKCKKRLIPKSSKTVPPSPEPKSKKVIKQLKVMQGAKSVKKPMVIKRRVIRKVVKTLHKKNPEVVDEQSVQIDDSPSSDKQQPADEPSSSALMSPVEEEKAVVNVDVDLELEDISASEDESFSYVEELEDVSSASDQLDDVSDTELPTDGDENGKEDTDPNSEVEEVEIEEVEIVEEDEEEQVEINIVNVGKHNEENQHENFPEIEINIEKDKPSELSVNLEENEQAEEDQTPDNKLDADTSEVENNVDSKKSVLKEVLADDDQEIDSNCQTEDDQLSENYLQAEDDQQHENEHQTEDDENEMVYHDQQPDAVNLSEEAVLFADVQLTQHNHLAEADQYDEHAERECVQESDLVHEVEGDGGSHLHQETECFEDSEHVQDTEHKAVEHDELVEHDQQTTEDRVGKNLFHDHLTENDQQADLNQSLIAEELGASDSHSVLELEEDDEYEQSDCDRDVVDASDLHQDQEQKVVEENSVVCDENVEVPRGESDVHQDQEQNVVDENGSACGEKVEVSSSESASMLSSAGSSGCQSELKEEEASDVNDSAIVYDEEFLGVSKSVAVNDEDDLDSSANKSSEEQSSELEQTEKHSGEDNLPENVSDNDSSPLKLDSSTGSADNSSSPTKKTKVKVTATKSPVKKKILVNKQQRMTTRSGRTISKKKM